MSPENQNYILHSQNWKVNIPKTTFRTTAFSCSLLYLNNVRVKNDTEMTQKPTCSPWTSSPGSHLHVVALLSLHFRVDAELLPGPQHTNLWPGYTKLTLKIRQARTLLYMLRFNISKVKDSGEADEPKARVRARTSQLLCVWLLCYWTWRHCISAGSSGC